jgi:hypothetical protein
MRMILTLKKCAAWHRSQADLNARSQKVALEKKLDGDADIYRNRKEMHDSFAESCISAAEAITSQCEAG